MKPLSIRTTLAITSVVMIVLGSVMVADASLAQLAATSAQQDIVVERVSVASDGTEANGPSASRGLWIRTVGDNMTINGPTPDDINITPDGRFVTFSSLASNLVPDDTNNSWDIFVHDRVDGVTERVSVTSDGSQVGGGGRNPDISADGRFVVFESDAADLVAGDVNGGTTDVFVHDRLTGATELISVSSDGTQGQSASNDGRISADGRFVAFTSTNPLAGRATRFNVFVRDRLLGTTENVNVSSNEEPGNSPGAFMPDISGDGRFVTFRSGSDNLVPDDTNGVDDIFVRDLFAGTTERVSVFSDGTEFTHASQSPEISADGRWIVFFGSSSLSRFEKLVIHDRETGVTEAVFEADPSEGVFGARAEGFDISADGRFVIYEADGSRRITRVFDGQEFELRPTEVYVADLSNTIHTIRVVSKGPNGEGTNGWSFPGAINGDGTTVAFTSFASNLVSEDTNETWDVFVRGAPAEDPNSSPEADAGPDFTTECTSFDHALAELDGSGSSDPDGDGLTFTWTGPFLEGDGTVSGPEAVVAVTLPVGESTVALEVSDGELSDTDDVVVTVTCSPERRIDFTIDEVEGLVSAGELRQRDARPLIEKLESAKASLLRDNPGSIEAATGKLEAFINQVEAYARSRRLIQAQADSLIDKANRIIEQIRSG